MDVWDCRNWLQNCGEYSVELSRVQNKVGKDRKTRLKIGVRCRAGTYLPRRRVALAKARRVQQEWNSIWARGSETSVSRRGGDAGRNVNALLLLLLRPGGLADRQCIVQSTTALGRRCHRAAGASCNKAIFSRYSGFFSDADIGLYALWELSTRCASSLPCFIFFFSFAGLSSFTSAASIQELRSSARIYCNGTSWALHLSERWLGFSVSRRFLVNFRVATSKVHSIIEWMMVINFSSFLTLLHTGVQLCLKLNV